MRIAFVGHAYHRLTKSCDFFLKILSGLGDVSCFYEDDGDDIDKRPLAFCEADYDLIVVWQIHQVLPRLSGTHANVVFVPMYDAMRVGKRLYWHKSFEKAKFLCFSKALHQEAVRRNAVSKYFQFFPDPSEWQAVRNYENIRAFFWYRKKPIDEKMVFALCGSKQIEEFRLHNAPDPGAKPLVVEAPPPNIHGLEISSWFEDLNGYKSAIQRSNVFFAPRLFEGIGMSFLQAMAAGLCVVAPGNPTMSEYIVSGETGILYDPMAPRPVDFDRIRCIGSRARESVERGYADWEATLPELLDFVATPQARIRKRGIFAR